MWLRHFNEKFIVHFLLRETEFKGTVLTPDGRSVADSSGNCVSYFCGYCPAGRAFFWHCPKETKG